MKTHGEKAASRLLRQENDDEKRTILWFDPFLEALVGQELQAAGNTILGSQVGVQTSQGLRYIDHLIQTPAGEIFAVEVKSGGALYNNAGQIAKDVALEMEGGTFTGSGGLLPEQIEDLLGKPISTIVVHVP